MNPITGYVNKRIIERKDSPVTINNLGSLTTRRGPTGSVRIFASETCKRHRQPFNPL
jgi:hypothetical protein